ncbi:hypothetical protein [Nocardia sp. NPDC005366]|uniref:hypothetical protein n=1 Tax=Nocardia sp. NPDC005366 TaxID=3156878 RepID=UPI0033BBE043
MIRVILNSGTSVLLRDEGLAPCRRSRSFSAIAGFAIGGADLPDGIDRGFGPSSR